MSSELMWVLVGLVLIVVYYLVWEICEWLWPVKYTGVGVEELCEHFRELYQRGGRGAEVLVREEESGKTLALRKWYYDDVWEPPVLLELILTASVPEPPGTKVAMAYLKEQGVKVRYGTRHTLKSKRLFPFWAKRKPSTKYKELLVCDCGGGIEESCRSAQLILCNVYGVPREACFTVRVIGKMTPYDCFIGPPFEFRAGSILPNHPAKPYKQWHKGGLVFYGLGHLIGRAMTEVHRFLFPPRGPGDDLRH